MSQQTTLATFFKKSGDDSEKKSSGGTDKLSPEASSSEPPAKKSKVLTPRGFCEDWLKRFNWLFFEIDFLAAAREFASLKERSYL